jgi:hypothetical protein
MVEIIDLSNLSADEKVLKVNELYNNSGEDFVFFTMESKVGKITDRVTRIYAKQILKFHASNYILFMVPDNKGGMKPFMSEKGTSAFCSDKEMEESLSDSLGDFRSFEEWVATSTFLYVFKGKRWRDLVKGCEEVDKLIGESSFDWFFRKYKDEFQWAMSEGRKVHLMEKMVNKDYGDIPVLFGGTDNGKK